jgi:hypothetical protein
VAVVEHRWVETLEKQLVEEGADTLTEQIAADVATQLQAGRDVAYTALSSAGVMTAARASVGEDSVEVSSLTATPEGISAEGVVVQRVPEGTGQPAGEIGAPGGSPASGPVTPPTPPSPESAPGGPAAPTT